jgi:hypothetical protein
LESVREKPFTYVVGDVEEEPITWQRSSVQPAVMEKQQLLKPILGEVEIFTEKDYVKTLILYGFCSIIALVNFYVN